MNNAHSTDRLAVKVNVFQLFRKLQRTNEQNKVEENETKKTKKKKIIRVHQ